MPGNGRDTSSRDESDLERVAREIAGRLSSLGIALDGRESPDDVERIAEAVEDFENAVESRGGDLMMDEPPRGSRAQPDKPGFAMPRRGPHESVNSFIDRLQRAAEDVRRGPRT
ncbi:MAG TPA: hypothetical protein VKH19_14755 [Gemmatimonadaceae bacterium]|nr:hypothetical protein [Gemmatimonadaceae bacterium]